MPSLESVTPVSLCTAYQSQVLILDLINDLTFGFPSLNHKFDKFMAFIWFIHCSDEPQKNAIGFCVSESLHYSIILIVLMLKVSLEIKIVCNGTCDDRNIPFEFINLNRSLNEYTWIMMILDGAFCKVWINQNPISIAQPHLNEQCVYRWSHS